MTLDELSQIADEIAACTACALSRSRTRTVPGEGPDNPSLLFVGEAPGWHEDQQGRPFVGPAGRFLEELLASISLKRDQVWIGNIVKCRPPDNRDPLPDEINACAHFLERQIALLRPKVLVTLGRYSLARFFPGESISRAHGRPKKQQGIIYFAMYHPAAALHQPSLRRTIEEDMKRIPALLESWDRIAEAQPEEPPVKQLTLF
ncbi:MAG: uracil-DNA glycosylase [Chloroflexi bacterium]|nr:uracil-DNA glycosylase [Chloroflexota bacterium]